MVIPLRIWDCGLVKVRGCDMLVHLEMSGTAWLSASDGTQLGKNGVDSSASIQLVEK
jgi:hypothetical protein